jgi:penicillin-binding protein 2
MTGRVRVLVGFVAFLFLSLTTRLWFLQVMAAEEYQVRAEGNRVRLVPLPAPRGRILDRNGNVLVGNRPSIQIVVNRRFAEDEDRLLRNLSELLDTPVEELEQRLEDPTYLPFQPVPVAEDVPKEVVFRLKERAEGYLGANYRAVTVREHVHKDLAAHLLGYLGEISQAELDDPSFSGYRPGDLVGRGGVEQHYERYLQGEQGWLSLQVDARGRIGETLGRKEPEPGHDLVLSVDLGLQRASEEALREAIEAARSIPGQLGYHQAPAGAVVALDPRDGHVLAMASFPTFDPGIFSEGLTDRQWERLARDPDNHFPLTNRAIQGQYPAASTLKPFMVAAALRAGMTDVEDYWPCPPSYEVPGDTSGTVFRNWKSTHSGHISLAQALAESCDTVFYEFGYRFYRERNIRGEMMQRQLRRWGFGRGTSVDLPGERAGRVPDSAWKQSVHEYAPKLYPQPLWLPGDNINMSIGQGDLLVTPLQLASAYAAIANGGTLYRPVVGLRVQEPDGPVIKAVDAQRLRDVPMNARARGPIHEGLLAAVTQGTAASAFAGFPHEDIPVAGKTGTAEAIVDGRDVDHSWFAAYAPAENPEIVVVAIVEQGGGGSQVAAPMVRQVLEAYFGLTPSDFAIGVATD